MKSADVAARDVGWRGTPGVSRGRGLDTGAPASMAVRSLAVDIGARDLGGNPAIPRGAPHAHRGESRLPLGSSGTKRRVLVRRPQTGVVRGGRSALIGKSLRCTGAMTTKWACFCTRRHWRRRPGLLRRVLRPREPVGRAGSASNSLRGRECIRSLVHDSWTEPDDRVSLVLCASGAVLPSPCWELRWLLVGW